MDEFRSDDLERIAEALLPEADKRKAVLTRWGAQPSPRVFAPTHWMAKHWLVQHDEYLTDQGSYARMIVTTSNWQTLHGWRGLLVVLLPERAHLPHEWHEVIDLMNHTPGVSTWTERLR